LFLEFWHGACRFFFVPHSLSLLSTKDQNKTLNALVDYIYSTLNLDLDYILPFAAFPENRREIDGLDDKSELARCIMLLRLLGAVKQKKASRNFIICPTQVVLPLSPNYSAMAVFIANQKYHLRRTSHSGAQRVGANISALPALLLGELFLLYSISQLLTHDGKRRPRHS
jgi:hypothetical protein